MREWIHWYLWFRPQEIVRDWYWQLGNAYWQWRKPEAFARLWRWRSIRTDRKMREVMTPILRKSLYEPMPMLNLMLRKFEDHNA